MTNLTVEAFYLDTDLEISGDEYALLLAVRKFTGDARQVKNAVYQGRLNEAQQKKMDELNQIGINLAQLLDQTKFGDIASIMALARLELESRYPRSKMGCRGHGCGKACGRTLNSVGEALLSPASARDQKLELFHAAIAFVPYIEAAYADYPIYLWAKQFGRASRTEAK